MKNYNLAKLKKIICACMTFVLLVSMPCAINKTTVDAVTTRSNALAYMTSMASKIWIPNGNLKIQYATGKYYTFVFGKKYRGIPYAQLYVTPWITDSSVSTETGFTNKLAYGSGYYFLSSASTGNDCCDAVLMAWRSCGFSIPGMGASSWSSTSLGKKAISNRLESSGIRLVGWSVFGQGVDAYQVVSATTRENAYLGYDMVQAGDALVRDGHVMMVVSVHTSQDYVTVIDQYGNGTVPGGSVFTSSSWRNNTNVTYAKLYDDEYIPVAIF